MSKKRILIVDDEPVILETVRLVLDQAGYQCLLARDGAEALTRARAECPDLMLLDIMLPEINGYRVCRLLKKDRRYAGIPIIMVTARTQDRDYVQGKECGADDYITKPFDFQDLLRIVERHLASSQGA